MENHTNRKTELRAYPDPGAIVSRARTTAFFRQNPSVP